MNPDRTEYLIIASSNQSMEITKDHVTLNTIWRPVILWIPTRRDDEPGTIRGRI